MRNPALTQPAMAKKKKKHTDRSAIVLPQFTRILPPATEADQKRNDLRGLEEDQARGGWNTLVTSIVEKMPLAMDTMDAAEGKSRDVIGGAMPKVTPPQQGREH